MPVQNDNVMRAGRAVDAITELLDIPDSYYAKARARYEALGDWFHREGAATVGFDCSIYPQGSFRLGTVVRPLTKEEEYDVDLVCSLAVPKGSYTQRQLKALVGDEVKAYADSNNVKDPVEEKKRCWRLNYADEVSFHIDVLPAVPEDVSLIDALVATGVPQELAVHAVAITDRAHEGYDRLTTEWLTSNPKGFARWFEGRMRDAALPRLRTLVEDHKYKAVDEIPTYLWKTPLQCAVQIMKRHRDVMFKESPGLKPISMILTTLAAYAYEGESSTYEALSRIVDHLLDWVRDVPPIVPNPVDPAEDFADAWSQDTSLESSFRQWYVQLQADLDFLMSETSPDQMQRFLSERLALEVGSQRARDIISSPSREKSAQGSPSVVRIPHNAPQPWSPVGT